MKLYVIIYYKVKNVLYHMFLKVRFRLLILK